LAVALDVEENAVNAVIDYVRERLQTALDEVNLGKELSEYITMPKAIYDDAMEPAEVPMVPSMCVWVDKSDDVIKDRALRLNVAKLRVMFIWTGKSKLGYRYCGAFTSITIRDPTYGQRVGRANVVEREYYQPVYRGQTAVRAAEVVIEIQQEVQRT
jgi:hypothetical protein